MSDDVFLSLQQIILQIFQNVWGGQLLGQSACQQGGEDAAEEAAEGEAGGRGGVAEPRVAVVGGDADLAPRPLLAHVHGVLVAGVGGAALVHL